MALTRSFKETISERAQRDPQFRVELLRGAVNALLAGELETGKRILRDYINGTLGFSQLAKLVNKSEKSLMRMLSDQGNPTAENLFTIIKTLQEHENISLQVST